MEPAFLYGASAGQAEIEEHNKVGFTNEDDDGSGGETRGGSASLLDKVSMTSKLHEMERDIAALKRVLAFM